MREETKKTILTAPRGVRYPSFQKRHGLLCCALALVLVAAVPGVASAAGFLDKLNQALKALPKPAATAPARTASTAAAAPADQSPTQSATPDSVKALIKVTPAISAGPFYLGMPADKAVAQMKASGLNQADEGQRPQDFMFQVRQVPNQTYVGGIIGARPGSNGVERFYVTLAFTMYPNPAVVTGLTRTEFYHQNQGPSVGNTIAALRKKYGSESFSWASTNTLYWLLDAQGHALSPAQVTRYKNKCGVPSNGQGFFDPNGQAVKVTNGLQPNAFGAPCDSVIVTQATVHFNVPGGFQNDISNGWDSVANGVVENLAVAIYDPALDQSATVVSHDVAANGVKRQDQQQIEAAKQRGGPNL